MAIHYRSFESSDIAKVKELTDSEIGENYYEIVELKDIQKRSIKDGVNCSLVLVDGERVLGIRLSFPPGQWQTGKGKGLSENLWPFPLKDTAYFQSLFIHKDVQKRGWGQRLSKASLAALKKLGAQGVVCHSWKESPNNSSQLYLKSMGFKLLKEHPHYWKEVDYLCPRCGKPCLCTAQEMYLNLNLLG